MKRDVPHFRIGLLLTEAGILAPKQLDDAIQAGERSGQPFLRVLVANDTLKQHELQAVIRAQSLIWSGLLDVERAIQALAVVHRDAVSIDDGLRTVGWSRPAGTMAETVVSSQLTSAAISVMAPAVSAPAGPCQYCGSQLEAGTTLCAFCTGENSRPVSSRIHIEPAWQRQAEADSSRIAAPTVPRDPFLMAFFSGCCIAGLGQMALGQTAKGITLLLLAIALAFGTGGVSSLLLFPIAALDAFLLADKLKRGKSIGTWEFF